MFLLRILFFAPIVFLAIPHASANQCLSPYTKTDICALAKKIQSELAPSLPMQLSKSLYLRHAIAIGPLLQLTALLNYDLEFLNNALQSQGINRREVDKKMRVMTLNSVCSQKGTRAFLGLGGEVSYLYQFNDGQEYMTIRLNDADCPSR